VAYLPICGFPRIPSSRARKQLRLGLPYASGDELVSLGFRVGNPSAIGGIRYFQHACLPVGATPINEQTNRDAQFASENGQ
jgi:hypothetical protein